MLSLFLSHRFSPEHLGITASSLLAWLLLEVLLIWLCLYLLAVNSYLRWLDIIAYCGYKYVCMIVILAGGMVAGAYGYYAALVYTALAIAYFLVSQVVYIQRTCKMYSISFLEFYFQNFPQIEVN